MKLIYKGKTKDVYELENKNVLLKFKDSATSDSDGNFDPGANSAGITIDGLGMASLKMTAYYFELLNKKNIPTHFISSDIENAGITVKPAETFGKTGIEVICRLKAVGSFYRRFKAYCTKEGMDLDSLVEIQIKDDEQGDPFIDKYGLIQLNILTDYEYVTIVTITRRTADILKNDFAEKGLELYDMKFEFGKINGEIVLIDDISPGNLRVYKNGIWLQPLELAEYFK